MYAHHPILAKALGFCGLLALSACMGSPGDIVQPGDAGTQSLSSNNGILAFHFEATAPDSTTRSAAMAETGDWPAPAVTTACGDATGIRLGITGEKGNSQVCAELWAPVTVSGDYAGGTDGQHFVADCMFTVTPGIWSIDEMSAIGRTGGALECCESTYPAEVAVSGSQTTEVNGLIQCETVQNGGLDIYASINTPPTIRHVEIQPSKFGQTCAPIYLAVFATDAQFDKITYSWSVVGYPKDAQYALFPYKSLAWFSSADLGDYMLRVVATDDLGASNQLDFPLHIVKDFSHGECAPVDVVDAAAAEAEVED